jgi:CRISPR/Cas system-associated exonuclease Cas4 (RecB family)
MSDLISRQAAIDALHMDTSIIPFKKAREYADATISEIRNRLEKLPTAQPEIIRCRNCKFASGDSRICMKFGHSPIGELDFCAWAERRTDG